MDHLETLLPFVVNIFVNERDSRMNRTRSECQIQSAKFNGTAESNFYHQNFTLVWWPMSNEEMQYYPNDMILPHPGHGKMQFLCAGFGARR